MTLAEWQALLTDTAPRQSWWRLLTNWKATLTARRHRQRWWRRILRLA